MIADVLKRMGLAAISGALAQLPQNKHAFTYTITGARDASPYLTRTLLPRLGGERRLMIHQIHRPDADPHMHNHPWQYADFRIICGGYLEERLDPDGEPGTIVRSELKPGDVNHLTHDTFHRITHVEPNTWTVGLIGPRVQSWGFLVGEELVDYREYFHRAGHQQIGGMS